MDENSEKLPILSKELIVNGLIVLIFIYLLGFFPLLASQKDEVNFQESLEESLAFSESTIIQENSLLSPVNPLLVREIKVARKIKVVVTAYSSSPWETDDTPYLTASGSIVRDGIVATNILPFGTKIRLSSLYGDKIFVVEDRMNPRKGYQVDIWHSSYWEAKQFGVKLAEMEIIEEG